MKRFFLELFIALRYLRGQSRTVIFSLGTRLSFFFMSLMVFIMVLVLSVFTGFQREVHKSLENSGYHITISRNTPGTPIENYESMVASLKSQESLRPHTRSAFGSISVNALLEVDNSFEGKAIRAIPVDPEGLEKGEMRDYPHLVHYNQAYMEGYDGGNYVLIGRELARYYGWHVGDKITLYLPQGGTLKKGIQVRQETFRIAGFFRTGYYEFDMNLIFMSLTTAQRVMFMPDSVTEVIVQLNDLALVETVKSEIRRNLPDFSYAYSIRTIRDERGNFLAALQLEKTMMIIIMGLLIIAGVAGIWVTVHLLVKAKSRSIGMLRAMGLPTLSVIVIFTAHSMLIGLLSTAVGGSLGIFLSERLETTIQLAEEMINAACVWYSGSCTPIELIPKKIYYFDHLPVYPDSGIIFGVAVATMILSGLAGYFPSRKAAMLDPVETIRND